MLYRHTLPHIAHTNTYTNTPATPNKGLCPRSRQELNHCRGTARGCPGQTGRLCPPRTGRMAQMGGCRLTDLGETNTQCKMSKGQLSNLARLLWLFLKEVWVAVMTQIPCFKSVDTPGECQCCVVASAAERSLPDLWQPDRSPNQPDPEFFFFLNC